MMARRLSIGTILLATHLAMAASVPEFLTYQGRLEQGNIPFTGDALFKFAIVTSSGGVLYTHDGSAGPEPSQGVIRSVDRGVFTVHIGSQASPTENMRSVPAGVFAEPRTFLRVWVAAPTTAPIEELIEGTFPIPHAHQFSSVPYALAAQRAQEFTGEMPVQVQTLVVTTSATFSGPVSATAGLDVGDGTIFLTSNVGGVVNGITFTRTGAQPLPQIRTAAVTQQNNAAATGAFPLSINAGATGLLNLNTLGTGGILMKGGNAGSVGVGSIAPGARFNVVPDAATVVGQVVQGVAVQTADLQQWQNGAGTVMSRIDNAGALQSVGANALTVNAGTAGSLNLNNTSTGNLLLGTGGGSVGIGTTTPGKRLHVAGAGSDPVLRLQNTGAQSWDVGSYSDGRFRIRRSDGDGLEWLTLKHDTGFAGFGVADPQARIHGLIQQGAGSLLRLESSPIGGPVTTQFNVDDAGNTLIGGQVDVRGNLALGAGTGGRPRLRFGELTDSPGDFQIRTNADLTGATGTADDPTRSAWAMRMGHTPDDFALFRRPPGGGFGSPLWRVDNRGRMSNLAFGVGTTAMRIGELTDLPGDFQIRTNAGLTSTDGADDPTRSAWALRIGPLSDDFAVFRRTPGGGFTSYFRVDATGNGILGTSGPTGATFAVGPALELQVPDAAQRGWRGWIMNSASVRSLPPFNQPELGLQWHVRQADGSIIGTNMELHADSTLHINGSFITGGPFIDLAEAMDVSGRGEPGDVLIVDENGSLLLSRKEQDPRVIGVVSSSPGMVLGGAQLTSDGLARNGKTAVAMAGTVDVKVTGRAFPAGTLLVSSSVPGRAEAAPENPKSGTVIGKALRPHPGGEGRVRMLVMLR